MIHKIKFYCILCVCLLISLSFTAFDKLSAGGEPRTRVIVLNQEGAEIEILCEIADNVKEITRGLMYRESLADNHGMLFIYNELKRRRFWMRNTLIPLSVAFIGEDMTIFQIEAMAPKSDKLYPSKYPIKYALEVNQGFFRKNLIKPGSRIFIQKNRSKTTLSLQK